MTLEGQLQYLARLLLASVRTTGYTNLAVRADIRRQIRLVDALSSR